MNVLTRYSVFCLFLLLTLFIKPAAAISSSELGVLLLEKGLITQQELDSLQKSDATLSNADQKNIIEKVAEKVKSEAAFTSGYGKKGFFIKSNDGNWQTNLRWRAQMRYTGTEDEHNAEMRRLRMKIGGHGYRPWLKYYFEVDLQPSRDSDDDKTESSTRVIDYRITMDKYKWLSFRVGQWKINYNRERVDSSGKQTFVERSIVNSVFTVDRQVGAMVFGRLFPGTLGDMRYYAGVFNGEGRAVNNDDQDMLYMGRLQWNFLGRDLKWRQSDVGFHEKPAGSIAIAAATNEGKCTKWSSSGCGNLSGFSKVAAAQEGQFEIDQFMVETAFKYRGFAWQQEYHEKDIKDTVNGTDSDLKGGYAQAGYFFHHLIPAIPEGLELAARYAFVDEPNSTDVTRTDKRKEYTAAVNYFFSGHNNKLTLDYSHLKDDDVFTGSESDRRVRVQWDVSF